MIDLVWENCQNKIEITKNHIQLIEQCIGKALEYEEFSDDAQIELLIVDNAEIKKINALQRNIDRITDVLSFPMLEFNDKNEIEIYEDEMVDGFVIVGSIVISAEKAAQQAQEYGHSLERELGFLTVHSCLHLLGYDHEISKQDEKEMFAKQEEILNLCGLVR